MYISKTLHSHDGESVSSQKMMAVNTDVHGEGSHSHSDNKIYITLNVIFLQLWSYYVAESMSQKWLI